MTQYEKIIRYLLKNRRGMTMHDAYMMYINSPHKRIGELEQKGIKIDRLTVKTEKGKNIVMYRLSDPGQEEIRKIIGEWHEQVSTVQR